MQNRAYSVLEIKSIDEDLRVIEGIATTPKTDRMEDIVEPEGAIFALPLPFLMHHDPHTPVGHVTSAKATADAALRARVEACRKEHSKTAANLLAAYDEHASAIGDIIAKLKAMDGEREVINAELRTSAVCEPVRSYVDIHRTTPGTEGTEQRAKVPCWVYRYPGSPPDKGEVKYQYEAARKCGARPLARMASRSPVLRRFIISMVVRSSSLRRW